MAEVRPAIDLPLLIEKFGSEDKCHAYLERLRWPEGVRCPRCDSDKISRIKKRRQFDCDECRYQFSVRVGTIFHDSKLPLWKWFLAVYMICQSKKGISSNQLKRMLGVSYKTAWFLTQRIRATMKEDNAERLGGVVEVDETFLGKTEGQGKGSHMAKKTIVVGAAERGGEIRLRIVPCRSRKSLRKFMDDNVDAETVYTDGYRGYDGTMGDAEHETVNHGRKEWIHGNVHTNTIEGVWSLLERSIIGSYHKLSVKHLPKYLDEMVWRYNNRENPFMFRDTVLRLVGSENLTYSELVA